MREISKIAKMFTCECGTVSKFEFETDFDIHDIRMSVKCQNCGKDRIIELMSFFARHPTVIKPLNASENQGQNLNLFDFPFSQNSQQFLAAIAQSPIEQADNQNQQNQMTNEMFSEAIPIGVSVNSEKEDNNRENKQSEYAGLLDLTGMAEDVYESFKDEKKERKKNDQYYSGLFGNI
ncbi:MAG: hypothetical protein NZ903_02320 [Candidatus Micrarchaeota archaeon]|nr:hypothetical protein [Candidatus Micrarchaeota archaeon]